MAMFHGNVNADCVPTVYRLCTDMVPNECFFVFCCCCYHHPPPTHHRGNTTAAHAVGVYLKQKYYNNIGPWVNIFESNEDKKYLKEKLNAAPSYLFDDTVNCTKMNDHDALLGDYCNAIVYDGTQSKAPFVTPGRQNIYVAVGGNWSSAGAKAREQMKAVERSMHEFVIRRGNLAKTDVAFTMTSSAATDGGLSKFEPDILKNYNQIGTAPPVLLGPASSEDRLKIKTRSKGLDDKYIQLRYGGSVVVLGVLLLECCWSVVLHHWLNPFLHYVCGLCSTLF
jgi:hypothetical protein